MGSKGHINLNANESVYASKSTHAKTSLECEYILALTLLYYKIPIVVCILALVIKVVLISKLAITLVSECIVLGNGSKQHQHMERIKVIGLSHSVDITRCLCPPPLFATPLAVSSVLLALHHKMTAHCLKINTKSNKHAFIPWNKRQLRML